MSKKIKTLSNIYTVLGLSLLILSSILIVIPIFPDIWYGINPTETEREVKKIDSDVVENKIEKTVVDREVIEIKEPEEGKPKETPSSTDWWKYPNIIYETKRDGSDLLVLVNKQYKLQSTYAPSDLVLASNADIRRGEGYYLRNIVISDLRDMVNTARENGIDLSIVSGYRSYQTQVDTYNYWLKKNNNNIEYVDTFSARPGHSQHQLGTVLDFSTNEINDKLGDSFANTKASKWLVENAYKYGWVISYPKGYENITGYKYESWHYRYIGKDNALEMKNNGMILENYLISKN